jgi:hypothetical protein
LATGRSTARKQGHHFSSLSPEHLHKPIPMLPACLPRPTLLIEILWSLFLALFVLFF